MNSAITTPEHPFNPRGTEIMNKDPVCGMEVDPVETRYISDHQGQTYYFCSAVCKQRFDQNPERYARRYAA
jgi:Cu+-exporting ATPase